MMDELIQEIEAAVNDIKQKLLMSDTLTADEKIGMVDAVKKDLANWRDQLRAMSSGLESLQVVRKEIQGLLEAEATK